MATHDYIISNASGAAVRADLNNALAAIVSNNSSATEPATTYAYQWWADTTAGQLKLRNSTNDGWNVISDLDGGTFMEDGTAALPGLPFTNDLNTGLFRPAADRLGISTGGVERVEFGTTEVVFNDGGADVNFRVEGDTEPNLLYVDAGTERIGVNTTTPEAKLDITSGTGATDQALLVSDTAAIPVNTDFTVQISTYGQDGSSGLSGSKGGLFVHAGFNRDIDIARFSSIGTGYIDVPRMVIKDSGNVGIGTSSPAHSLTLDGANPQFGIADGLGNYSTIGVSQGGAGQGNLIISTSTDTDFLVFQRGATETMRIDSAGNVGIGTTSPAVELDVNGEVRASSGILFGTDTATANALDDYEEGTWTPVLVGGTTAGSYAYVVQTGTYTKIGNLVTVFCNLDDISQSSAGSGAAQITGLPFTNGSDDAIGSVRFNAIVMATSRVGVASKIGASGTFVNVVSMKNDSNSPNLLVSDITYPNAGIQITITYRVA